ncbi:MAG: hypothetical protein AB1440_02385 [Pseudomonadota bacterium]|jgi:hypothetical protein
MAKPHRHPEKRDVQPRVLVAFGGGLLLFVAMAAIFVKLTFDTTPTWLPLSSNTNPDGPALQVKPEQDLTALRAEEDRQLRILGWVDRKAGIARIPIDDAMRAMVSKGLPDWSRQGATETQAGECALLGRAVPRAPQAQNCQGRSGTEP